jgi:dUTP pyrophosphatase
MPVLSPPASVASLLELAVFALPHAPQALPAYATTGSAGLDLQAAMDAPITLAPLQRALVPTGYIIAVPQGYEAQIRARSGLSIKFGITLINAVGTIDSDYRDELMIPLVNLSQEAYTIHPGDRVAQLLLAPVYPVRWVPVVSPASLPPAPTQSPRVGGFGSTGV